MRSVLVRRRRIFLKTHYHIELYNTGHCIQPEEAVIFKTIFINKLIIRLFDYSVFAASERTDPWREGDAKILFNFEWP